MSPHRYRAAIPLLVIAVLALANCEHRGNRLGQSLTAAHPIALIPRPAQMEVGAGHYAVDSNTPILLPSGDAESAQIAGFLSDHLQQLRGFPLLKTEQGPAAASISGITLSIDSAAAGLGSEGYRLDVGEHGIAISAATHAGLFHGAVTLWQLLTADDSGAKSIEVPELHIVDVPRFAWRGLELDVARHYQPPAFIRQLIDWMALHKLNTLHWHLTDDQGWRLQIKKYPRLTEIGAWRIPHGAAPGTAPVGGYYTQDEVRDLVRYAQLRYITIVPEIDVPGHAQAAIAAYPALGSLGDRPAVSPDWGIHPYLLNVNESTFDFVADVLDEVTQLFPGPYIHVGGDEAVKDQWRASQAVQQRMHALGIKDENALQGYFMQRVAMMLAAHGRKLVGWDEIVDAGLPAEATVTSWRGSEGAVTAARAGHDVIMSPSNKLYFDHIQGSSHDEPPGRPPAITLQDVYRFDPLPQGLDAVAAHHIIGMQANVWGEYMPTAARVEHAVFPRIAALSEVAWSPSPAEWSDFMGRLVPMLGRYRGLGIDYAGSALEVQIDVKRVGDGIRLTLSNQAAFGEIHYTLDGSAPGPGSPRYVNPLPLDLPVDMSAATFVDGRTVSTVVRRHLDERTLMTRNSDELVDCAPKLPLRLGGPIAEDGSQPVYAVDIMNPCWVYGAAPLDRAGSIGVRLARLPYNFSLGADIKGVVLRPPSTSDGEVEVHQDDCNGALLAHLPLDAKAVVSGTATLTAAMMSASGDHDLCIYVTAASLDPLWVLDAVWLTERRPGTRASVSSQNEAAFQTARRGQ